MVKDSRDHLEAWVRSISDAQISFERPPTAPAQDTGVSLYLLEVSGRRPHRPARPDQRQLELSYMVTASGPDALEAQQLLVDLCFAAMDEPAMEIDLDPPDHELWQALGVPPQATFKLSLPIRRRRAEREVRPVLEPLVVESASLSSLAGVVRTPRHVAIPEARVEAPATGVAATTDRRGRFRLEGVPNGDRPVHLRVRARGRQVDHEVGQDEDRSAVVITLDPTEAVDG